MLGLSEPLDLDPSFTTLLKIEKQLYPVIHKYLPTQTIIVRPRKIIQVRICPKPAFLPGLLAKSRNIFKRQLNVRVLVRAYLVTWSLTPLLCCNPIYDCCD
jgi:hypothetical protein